MKSQFSLWRRVVGVVALVLFGLASVRILFAPRDEWERLTYAATIIAAAAAVAVFWPALARLVRQKPPPEVDLTALGRLAERNGSNSAPRWLTSRAFGAPS